MGIFITPPRLTPDKQQIGVPMKALTIALASLGTVAFVPYTWADDSTLEEVIVTAEYRPVSVLELPTSITVFDQQAIDRRGAVHLEQLLNLAPNVNLSSGASRGRFVQIRGIGERSQFVEPINPSVGLIIDGMDFTGIGS
jgi:iron complex outermembrane receptor protein